MPAQVKLQGTTCEKQKSAWSWLNVTAEWLVLPTQLERGYGLLLLLALHSISGGMVTRTV